MFGCDGDNDIVVYRRMTLGWLSVLYRRRTYSRLYLHEGGAWMCSESYMLLPGAAD